MSPARRARHPPSRSAGTREGTAKCGTAPRRGEPRAGTASSGARGRDPGAPVPHPPSHRRRQSLGVLRAQVQQVRVPPRAQLFDHDLTGPVATRDGGGCSGVAPELGARSHAHILNHTCVILKQAVCGERGRMSTIAPRRKRTPQWPSGSPLGSLRSTHLFYSRTRATRKTTPELRESARRARPGDRPSLGDDQDLRPDRDERI